MLGLDEEQYLIKSELGQELLNNSDMFLSKRAIKSFGGYAGQQLRRLQNAIARDTLPQSDREKHILRSVTNALEDFNRRYATDDQGGIRLYIDDSDNPEFDTEIFVDADYKHFPLRDYTDLWGTMRTVVRDYDKIGKRNKKKDDNHLNKHAMHLVSKQYFSEKSAIYHYYGTANGTYQEYLQGDTVRYKKYFYALRPLLAAEYIEKYHVSPPVLFADLMSLDMDPALRTAIEDLLEIKKQTTEKEENPQIPVIREFIESEIAKQKAIADEIPDDHNKDWKALNRLFAEIIAKNV